MRPLKGGRPRRSLPPHRHPAKVFFHRESSARTQARASERDDEIGRPPANRPIPPDYKRGPELSSFRDDRGSPYPIRAAKERLRRDSPSTVGRARESWSGSPKARRRHLAAEELLSPPFKTATTPTLLGGARTRAAFAERSRAVSSRPSVSLLDSRLRRGQSRCSGRCFVTGGCFPW